jgi:hypothetical protein
MLTEKQLEAAILRIMDRIDEVNYLYMKKVAEQLQIAGELNATSVHRIIRMIDMGADIREITKALADGTNKNIRDVMVIYQAVVDDVMSDPTFSEALKANPLTRDQADRIVWFARNVATQTAEKMINLSNTTAIEESYREAVDKAILATSLGQDSYKATAQQIIRELGGNGLKVVYESGYRRRLDSAVRQNIIDGVNQINQNASLAMGEMLGYDAVQISAHRCSAPDHEPVQGHIFYLKEFEKMQNGEDCRDINGRFFAGFRRPIGEWNCMHIAMSFDTKTSISRYTDDQLKDFIRENHQGCEIGGKHYTLYQARQIMRQMETEIRRAKDKAVAAHLNGNDMDERRRQQRTINELSAKYQAVASASGLQPQMQRTSVEGFRMVKV